MTEPTVSHPGESSDVGPVTAKVDGQPLAPPATSPESTFEAGLAFRTRSQWSYARMRFFRHRLALLGLLGLVIIFGAGIFANYIAPGGFSRINLGDFQYLAHPTAKHLFGTDDLGRDEFNRVIWGIRTSMEVGVFVAVVSSLIGMVVGAVAGYYGGWIDNALMRLTDLVLTLPALAILLTAAALLGQGSQWRVSAILVAFFWTGIARVVRGVYLSLREKEYVEAAKASGAGDMRLMFRHILPNTLGPIIVNGTLAVGSAILVEAALSFLGFGIKPPTPSLGGLVNDAQRNPQQWWLTIFPGLTIVLIVLCVNFVGDGLRDALDPTQRRMRA